MFGQMFFGADVLVKLRLRHHLRGLLRRAAEDQCPVLAVEPVGKIECAQARPVDRGHVAEAQNHDGREIVGLIEDPRQLVRRAEQERLVDSEHRHVVGNPLVPGGCGPARLRHNPT